MKLELKKVKVINEMSEETTCFHAVLYVDGKKAADCSNTGKGGMTDVRFYDIDVQYDVMKYCKENPVVNVFRGKEHRFTGVDIRVDELLVQYQMAKILKTKQKKSLVLHLNKLNDPQYIVHSFLKFLKPVDDLMKDEAGRQMLKTQIESFRRKGYTIMNTNIDYKSLGV